MKTTSLLIALIFSFSIYSVGQIDQMIKKVEDVGVEAQGLLTLRFNNASDGAPVAYASIKIDGNKSILTDVEGKIRFEKKPDGIYPFRFEKKGFISEDLQIEISAGKIINNRFIVSSLLKKNEFRIVLVWNEQPADLDMNFIKKEEYKISSKDLGASPDSLVVLEGESDLGYGPESIKIHKLDSLENATFSVIDFSNKDEENSIALMKSNALIKVYCENKLTHFWKPSKKQIGNTWMVFTIQNGQIVPTEEVMNY